MHGGDRINATTTDHLLGGRVIYTQPRHGFRAAIDPVLLAATIPARRGDRVLDGGTGAGAALLCLAARVPGLIGTGVDRDPGLARLGRANAAANGFPDLSFVVADLAMSPIGGPVDHAFANPPYHPESSTASPLAERDTAKRGGQFLLPRWISTLSTPLRHRGTLTFILPMWLLETALASFRLSGVPCELLIPVWPKVGRTARWVVVRGRKNGRAPLAMAPGLILHEPSGAFQPEAEAILRDGASFG